MFLKINTFNNGRPSAFPIIIELVVVQLFHELLRSKLEEPPRPASFLYTVLSIQFCDLHVDDDLNFFYIFYSIKNLYFTV